MPNSDESDNIFYMVLFYNLPTSRWAFLCLMKKSLSLQEISINNELDNYNHRNNNPDSRFYGYDSDSAGQKFCLVDR